MMELKTYQSRALDAFTTWLEALQAARNESEVMTEAVKQAGADIPAALLNYPKSAWEKLSVNGDMVASAGVYVDRTDKANRPIPHVCFKVPTGGGKTLLAASALERLQSANRTNVVGGADQGNLCANQSGAVESRTPLPPNLGTRKRRQGKNVAKGRSVQPRRHCQLSVRHAADVAGNQPSKRQRVSADVPRLELSEFFP